MNKIHGYIFSALILFASCGTEKTIATEKQSVSSKDYPYITKFHEGMRLKIQGRTDEAIEKLQECLLIRQDDDAVYYALSELELAKGNLEKSAEYILKAIEIDPDNTWYIQELAYMYFEQKNYEKSAENFKRLVEIEPRNVDWLFGYSEVLVRIGETEKAIEELDKTEDQVGINPGLSIKKFDLYISIKQVDKAMNEIARARKVFPNDPQLIATLVDYYFTNKQIDEAVDMLQELVIADPENGRAHLALADVYRQNGDNEKAYAELKLAFNTEDLDIDTKMQILTNILESSYKIDPEVYELIDILVASHPNEAKAHAIKGDYLLRAEKEDEALKSYQKALEFDNSKYPIWNQVLIMEYQAGNFEDLYRDSKECLTLFPSVSTVYLLYGVSANRLKKYDEALDALVAGVELVVGDKPLEAEFYGQMGEAHFGLSAYDAAKKNYKKAIELDKHSSLLKNNFAYRLAMAKIDLEMAESLAKQAVEAAPNQSQFIDTYGWVLFQKGEYDKAMTQFDKAYALNDTDKMIVEHIGDAYFKKGNIEQALIWWNKAKEISDSSEILNKKIEQKKYYDPIF